MKKVLIHPRYRLRVKQRLAIVEYSNCSRSERPGIPSKWM
jgi:hypothetical protein